MMQKLEGEFALYYNRKRSRRGAFWEDRFHSTMIAEGSYFLNCLVYIHLNMVRAGVVSHPMEWRWCGHDELVGERVRYRLIDQEAIRGVLGPGLKDEFEQAYRDQIEDALARGWRTRSLSNAYRHTRNRRRLDTSEAADGVWVVRETLTPYAGSG